MVYLLFASLLSGIAALNYELLWIRELVILAGSTQAAISCVLSVYFLGLALGNYLAGRFARRLSRPLMVYAGVELIIGLWAILFHALLGSMDTFYAALYDGLPAGSPMIHVLRLTGAAGLLLVPATCMGATLPLLAQFGARDLRGASRWSAALYGVNTLGAMLGTFATGFFLVERFGVSLPLRMTGLLNVCCVLCVLPWIRQRRIDQGHVESPESAASAISGFGVMLLLSFAVLGVCNIAVEVLWTRLFALFYPNDTYIFSTILLMYLFGVGVGSLVGRRFLARIERPVYVLGMLQLISAACTVCMVLLIPELFGVLDPQPVHFSVRLANYFLGVGAGTIIQTLCMGASFPLLMKAVMTHHQQVGDIVGRALSWNTIGGVLGALAGGFILLDRLGVQTGLFIAAALTALVGLTLCATTSAGRRAMWLPAAGLGAAVSVTALVWPPDLPEALLKLHFPPEAGCRILEVQPSIHGTVAITEDRSQERMVWINSIWVARERAHLTFGYAPWILHPGPVNSALGICCGTGRTFGALRQAGIQDLDLVDINASVIELSRKWFARSNHEVLTDPSARIIIDDGRNFVRYGRKKYDLITLEPLQMFQKGVVNFYTEEFYREARERLAEGGVICQWAPIYLVTEHQFKSMVKTFNRVFPNSLLWGRRYNMVLLGYNSSDPKMQYNEEEIYARMSLPAVRSDLRQEGIFNKFDCFIYSMVAGNSLSALGETGNVYTDDRPALEFTAARTQGDPQANLLLIKDYLVPLGELFDLPDNRVTEQLELLRMLHLKESYSELQVGAEFTAAYQHLYGQLVDPSTREAAEVRPATQPNAE